MTHSRRCAALPALALLVLALPSIAAAPLRAANTAPPPASTGRPAEAAAAPAEGAGRPTAATEEKPKPPSEEELAKGPLRGLEYRLVGPAIGGRVSRVTGVPGDPSTWFAAT